MARSDRLDRLAIAVLAAMPAIMVISTRSSPVILAIFAGISLASRLTAGGGKTLAARIIAALKTPLTFLVLAALAFVTASLAWTPDPAFAADYAAQLAGNAVLIFFAIMVAPRFVPERDRTVLAIGLALATGLLLVELLSHGAIMSALGSPPRGNYRVNRVVVTVVVLLPVAVFMLSGRPRGWLSAGGLTALVGAMTLASASGAAVLGVGVGLLSLAVAVMAPRIMVWVFGLGAVALCLAMPVLAPHANDIIPPSMHELMRSASSEVRGDIWRIYADIGQAHLLRGYGLEASRFIIDTDAAAGLPPAAIELLSYGHPHNAPLQVWFELGFIGAVIAAAMLFVATRRMDRLPESFKPLAATSLAVMFAVACVSHGAWQAWWISATGAVLVWWRMLLEAKRRVA